MQILGFVAAGCGPCLQQRPIWAALPVPVTVVDVDAEPELRSRYAVEGLPTTVVLQDGSEPVLLRGLSTTRQILEVLGSAVA